MADVSMPFHAGKDVRLSKILTRKIEIVTYHVVDVRHDLCRRDLAILLEHAADLHLRQKIDGVITEPFLPLE
jgi:hypothetical protein